MSASLQNTVSKLADLLQTRKVAESMKMTTKAFEELKHVEKQIETWMDNDDGTELRVDVSRLGGLATKMLTEVLEYNNLKYDHAYSSGNVIAWVIFK